MQVYIGIITGVKVEDILKASFCPFVIITMLTCYNGLFMSSILITRWERHSVIFPAIGNTQYGI